MQARQNRRSNHRSLSLDRSTERRILVQRQMRSRLIVRTGIRGQDPMQMPRSEDDNVIEAIAPSGSARISAAIENGTTRMASSLSSACEVHHPPGKNVKLD